MDPPYIEYYANVILECSDPRAGFVTNMAAPGVFDERQVFGTAVDSIRSALEATSLYGAFLKPLDLGSATCLATSLSTDPGVAAGIGLHREMKKGPRSRREREIVDMLAPHLCRASDICLAVHTRTARSMADSLLALQDIGVFILASNGTLSRANATTDAMIESNDGLTMRNGTPGALDPAADAAMRAAISPCLHGVVRDPPRPFEVPRPTGKAPCQCCTYPFTRDPLGSHALALIVKDRASPSIKGIDTLMESHPLTAAELGLAKARWPPGSIPPSMQSPTHARSTLSRLSCAPCSRNSMSVHRAS